MISSRSHKALGSGASLLTGLRSCRLCWRVTIWVFLAILAVEAIILFFSVERFEQDRVSELEREALVVARSVIRQSEILASDSYVERTGPILRDNTVLMGMRVWNESKGTLGTFGIEPPLGWRDAVETNSTVRARSPDGKYLFIRWSPARMKASVHVDATIILTEVAPQVRAFVVRIAGLVLIISLAVTAVTMFVLERFVLRPIRELHGGIRELATDPFGKAGGQLVSGGNDELGEFAVGFNNLSAQLNEAFSRIESQNQELIEKAMLEQENQAKRNFMASMSHELRTPLNAILGFSEMIRDQHLGPISPDVYISYAADIRKSGEHLLHLVDQLLNIERIDSGRIDLEIVPLDPEPLVLECWRYVSIAISKGISFTYRSEESELLVHADKLALRQILINLLSNAAKFSPEGGCIIVSVEADCNWNAIRISDNGSGIDPSVRKNLLEPFSTTNKDAYTTGDGVGLGLAITNGLLTAHQGRLRMIPNEPNGTVAVAEFPRRQE